MERHLNRRHKCRSIVSSLLDDLVSEIQCESEGQGESETVTDIGESFVSDILYELVENLNMEPTTYDVESPHSTSSNFPVSSEVQDICECEYDKIRIRNIAECRAIFRSIFSDPDEFKMPKVTKKVRIRRTTLPQPSRFSSRLRNRLDEAAFDQSASVTSSNVEVLCEPLDKPEEYENITSTVENGQMLGDSSYMTPLKHCEDDITYTTEDDTFPTTDDDVEPVMTDGEDYIEDRSGGGQDDNVSGVEDVAGEEVDTGGDIGSKETTGSDDNTVGRYHCRLCGSNSR